MALRFNTQSHYSTLSESSKLSEGLLEGPILDFFRTKYNETTSRQPVRSNLRTLWRSVSNDCLPQLSRQCSGGQIGAASARQSSSSFLTSVYPNVSDIGPLSAKLNEKEQGINEPVLLPSSRGLRSSGSSINTFVSPPVTTDSCPDVSSPAFRSNPVLYSQGEGDAITRFSETNLLTLDSFMEIESIDEHLESTLGTEYTLLNSNDKHNALPNSSSLRAIWQSLTTNSSTFLSIFESRNKRSQLEEHCLPPSSQNKQRGLLNFNQIRSHRKSFSLPPGRFTPITEQKLQVPSQLTPQTKGKLPILRKRVSAVFRSESWNQDYPLLRDLLGTDQDLGTKKDLSTNSLCSTVLPTSLKIPQTHAAALRTASPNLTCKHVNLAVSAEPIRRYFSCDNDGRTNHSGVSGLLSGTAEGSTANTTPLLRNKPLPNIPSDNVCPEELSVVEEGDTDDKASTSSCLGSVTDCFTMLNAEWPEPPRHMTFLDPDMTETLRYGQSFKDEMTDMHSIHQHSNTFKNHDAHIRRNCLKAFVDELLSSVEVYTNGSRVLSHSPFPNTLIFPTGTTIDQMGSGYTVQLAVRAPERSLLVSFCTLYTDTTLTYEQQNPSITNDKVHVEVSIRSGALPNQKNYEELSVGLTEDIKKEVGGFLDCEDETERHRILIELPCTLGELAIMITNMHIV